MARSSESKYKSRRKIMIQSYNERKNEREKKTDNGKNRKKKAFN